LKPNFLSKSSRILPFFLAVGFIILLIPFLFNTTFSNQEMSIEVQYNLLISFIFLLLLVAAFLVVWALKHWGYEQKPWVTLFAAYGLPFLAIVITYIWLQLEQAPLIEGRLINSFFRTTWQALLYFWQVMILLFSFRFLYPAVIPRQILERKHIVIGILTGLGSGLINVYMISVISNLPINQSLALSTSVVPPLLKWSSSILAISLAPYAFERFFRQILVQSWQTRFGSVKGFWLVAVTFALLTFQPTLMLPALCSAILYGLLIQTQPFGTVVIAHAVTNALILFVGWQWVY
jgi:membrane protease YdiL (CAAX protease family)